MVLKLRFIINVIDESSLFCSCLYFQVFESCSIDESSVFLPCPYFQVFEGGVKEYIDSTVCASCGYSRIVPGAVSCSLYSSTGHKGWVVHQMDGKLEPHFYTSVCLNCALFNKVCFHMQFVSLWLHVLSDLSVQGIQW